MRRLPGRPGLRRFALGLLSSVLAVNAAAELGGPRCSGLSDNWRMRRACVQNQVDNAALDCFRRDWQAYAAVKALPRDAQVAGAKVIFSYSAAWNEVMYHDLHGKLPVDEASLVERHCAI